MTLSWRRLGLAAALVCATWPGAARAEVSASDRELVKKVFDRLVAVAEPPDALTWPPDVDVVDQDTINAYAYKSDAKEGGKPTPHVRIYRGLLEKIIQGDADRLAYVLGHELGHAVLLHVKTKPAGTVLVEMAATRDQELAADRVGAELLVKAGFSLKQGLTAIKRFMELGMDYSAVEGLGTDHPSWKERIAELDKDQEKLWRSMSAFQDGTYFLVTEQYIAAERCFRIVTREFPQCPEAWANLGYALLMQYCDGLEPEDLRGFDLGQILVGGFYRRPESLESQVRGKDEKKWWDAVGALREALRLQPDLVLAKANLGVAYLLRPDGKDVGEATRFLHEAAEQAAADKNLDPLVRAAVLINTGVADLAAGQADVCEQKLDQGEALGRQLAGGTGGRSVHHALANAILYNRALMLSRSADADRQKKAVTQLEQYLKVASLSSAWWQLAYERYAELCKQLGLSARSLKDMAKQAQDSLRTVTTLQLSAKGATLHVGQPLAEVKAALGQGQTSAVGTTNLVRVRYPALGIEVLAGERVLAVFLVDAKAPAVPVRGTGTASATRALRVGMDKDELDNLLTNETYDFRQLDDPDSSYRFYANLGLAVRVAKGKVVELVIALVPRRRTGLFAD